MAAIHVVSHGVLVSTQSPDAIDYGTVAQATMAAFNIGGVAWTT
jgi:hypothetical protein